MANGKKKEKTNLEQVGDVFTGIGDFVEGMIYGIPDITQKGDPPPPPVEKSSVYTDSSKLFPQVPKYPSPAQPPRDPSKDRPADSPVPQKTLREEVGDIAAPSLEALGLAATDPADAPMETGEDFGGGTAPFEAPQYEGTPPPKPAKTGIFL